jgi:hypothetical protein
MAFSGRKTQTAEEKIIDIPDQGREERKKGSKSGQVTS